MIVPTRTRLMITAAAVMTLSMPAAAQEAVSDQANEVAEQAEVLAQETNDLTNTVVEQSIQEDTSQVRDDDRRGESDDDDFPWGLLGLLGLAGLLGLKRKDRDHDRHTTGSTGNRM